MKTIEFKIYSENDLRILIDNAVAHRPSFNNLYGIDLNGVECARVNNSICVRKKFDSFNRIYLVAETQSELKEIIYSLEVNDTINIPSKTDIGAWDTTLISHNYRKIASYSRYVYREFPIREVPVSDFAMPDDLERIYYRLYEIFSPVTGHLPNQIELARLIENKNILVNRDAEGAVNGALCFTATGKKGDLPFWYDDNEDMKGLYLLYNAFSIFKNANIKFVYLWINDDNRKTRKIHKLLGVVPDGLIDNIYCNKNFKL